MGLWELERLGRKVLVVSGLKVTTQQMSLILISDIIRASCLYYSEKLMLDS
jgi:hypothetical protein